MIQLEKLKLNIENNDLENHFIVYKCDKSSEFITYQYADLFCKNNDLEIKSIESAYDIPNNGLFGSISNYLFLYHVESLNEDLQIDVSTNNFIWVVCNKINAKYKKLYENSIVEIPKLQEWQIKDFITSKCNGLKEKEVDELFSYYKNDLFRLDNELDKINLIGNYQKVREQLFVDVSNFNVFDITNAIVKRDKAALSNIYKEIDSIDVDSFGFISILITNFKHIIDIQLAKNATAESVGVSGKQFWAIKNYSCGYYNRKELMEIYSFLNGLDYKIKTGELDTSILIDYIICKILTI